MAISQKLHTKLVQKLILTPSLQQAIKLLPMSTLELSELLNQEMVENPMLEEVPTEELQPVEAAQEKPEEKKDKEKGERDPQEDTRAHASAGDANEDADQLEAAVDRALQEAEKQPSDEEESSQRVTAGAREKSFSEEEQAREQMLRQIPDDPAGLLRAKIRRHLEREERRGRHGRERPHVRRARALFRGTLKTMVTPTVPMR